MQQDTGGKARRQTRREAEIACRWASFCEVTGCSEILTRQSQHATTANDRRSTKHYVCEYVFMHAFRIDWANVYKRNSVLLLSIYWCILPHEQTRWGRGCR